jgi:type VI secretion system protein ImpJ
MTMLSKVVWQEGMHLAQHHFQLQSRYFEDAVAFALSNLFYRPYGLAGLELDAEALRNGTVAVVHARGITPDGLPFHFPDGDPCPPPRDIRELLSPTQDAHVVLLTIPPYRAGQANCVIPPEADGRRVRYVADTREVPDETTGRDARAVSVGRKNFRLRLDVEPSEDVVALPLARVRRDGAGNLVYDPEFIPPLLQVGASERLMDLARRLVDILEAKADALARQRRADAGEVVTFWATHAIHSSLGPLRHHLDTRRARPDQLYTELARLAGALCTFALDSHPRSLPLYDHDRAAECFAALERHIRSHLDLIVPTGYLTVSLQRPARYPLLRTGAVEDGRCFGPSQWFLVVRSGVAANQVIGTVPTLLKVCSSQHIARVVKEALPGLRLDHVSAPPAAAAPRAGAQYFRMVQTGPCWEAIVKNRDVGVYVPEPLTDAECELVVVPESPGLGSP